MTGALAIFAKTPGISPVKTRLGATLGTEIAEAFYYLSIKAIEEIAISTKNLSNDTIIPYWAIAEQECLNHPLWQNLECLWTGEGDLGMRINHIYNALLMKHDYVILIGTDSPQMEPTLLLDAASLMTQNKHQCVVGPCLDGGFYLFAGNIPLPITLWTTVVYSREDTLEQLMMGLEQRNLSVHRLSLYSDVDYACDLNVLRGYLESADNLLSAQYTLLNWLQARKDLV